MRYNKIWAMGLGIAAGATLWSAGSLQATPSVDLNQAIVSDTIPKKDTVTKPDTTPKPDTVTKPDTTKPDTTKTP